MRESLGSGVLAGYPVVDVKVTLVFGSYHDVDSNENAFRMAGSLAFKDGMRRAQLVLLEPMMNVEVEKPDDFTGNVMGDLSSRRGMVQGMEEIPGGGGKLVHAEVPLAEMFGYSTVLRSLTQGRATYSMEFKHYARGRLPYWTYDQAFDVVGPGSVSISLPIGAAGHPNAVFSLTPRQLMTMTGAPIADIALREQG